MSLAPYTLAKARTGLRIGHAALTDSMLQDGLIDAFNDYHVDITAGNLVDCYKLTRERQDAYAARSQERASAVIAAGHFNDEITAVDIPQRKGEPRRFNVDEQAREDAAAQSMVKLRPAFNDGSLTSGSSSTLNDGAAAVMLMSATKAHELGLPVLATIQGYANSAVDPAIMGIGPVPATKKFLASAGWKLEEVDLIEANEAFAAQAFSVGKELEWDIEKVNVNGGAIALGHPHWRIRLPSAGDSSSRDDST